MRNSLKRAFAFLLAGMMIFSVIPANAFAEETTKTTVTVATDLITTGEYDENSDALKTKLISADTALTVGTKFYVPIVLANITEFNFFEFKLLYDPSVFEFTDAVGVWEDEENDLTWGKTLTYNKDLTFDASVNSNVGMMSSSAITATTVARKGYLMFAGFEVIGKSTTGTEEIGIQAVNEGTAGIGIAQQTAADQITYIAGTVSVEKEASSGGTTTPTNYEIYYTLEKTADGTNAGFKAYDVNEEVKATVYLVNKGEEDINLQAYDIYLDYDSALIYQGTTLQGAIAYKADGTDDDSLEDVAEAEDKVIHIQAVGDNTSILENLAVNTPVPLGTITFSIDGDTAVYGTKMPITLTKTGSDKETTNIAVGGETEGDKKSYYPTVTQTVGDVTYSGAEVNTKYTVTFDANGGEFAENAVTSQDKQHNVTLTLNPSEPTRTGFDFKGWSTEDGEENSVNVGTTYGDNADEIFYAVWEKNTVTVTFHANNGTDATVTQEVPYNTETALTGNTFTRTGHGFSKWTTNADGSGTVYADGANVTITETLDLYAQWTPNKYTVIWKGQDGNTVLETDDKTAVYGTAPSYDGENPVKDDTAEFDYEFVGWATEPNQTSGTEEDKLPAVSGDTTYYAAFSETRRSYTVTFNMDGKADNQEQSVTYGEKVAKPETDPTNEHYTFINWYEDENCTIEYKFDEKTITGPTTIYAKWEAKTYYVTFESNGGTDSMAQQGIKYGDSDNLTPNAFKAPEGMEFLNWKDADGNTYGDGESITLTGNITLTAQWGAAEYKVNIAEGIEHGSVTANPSAANMNAEITLTITPGEGYELDKLTVTDAKSDPVNVSDDYKFTMPGSDVTVTATFKLATYTVTVDSANIQNGKVTATPTSGNMDAEISLTAEPETGYKLTGYTVTKADNTTFNVGTDGKFNLPASNVTVTATFEPITYTVEFNANGGVNTMNSMENVDYNTTDKLTKNLFEKTGHKFLGWSTTEDGEVAYADEASAAALTTTDGATVILYAVWQAETYNVTLNTDGGTINNGEVSEYTYGTGATLPTDVTREHYTFDGWYDSEGKKVTSISTTDSGDKSYTATWTPDTYTVKLDAKGGTIAEGKDVTGYSYGIDVSLPVKEDMIRAGYEFVSWHTDADCTSDAVTEIAAGTIGNQTFYAKWNPVQYKITFVVEGGKDIAPMTYDYEDIITLPEAESNDPMFKFDYWALEEKAGGWYADTYAAGKHSTGFYGNVTLTAVWQSAASYEVEEYLYARTGWYMLRVADDLEETQEYQFDGKSMYYIEDPGYAVEGSGKPGTFYTLIEAKYVEYNKLTAAAYELLQSADATARATINYNGDINDDKVVNVADANIVYQMVKLEDGNYYSEAQLTVEQRLAADMHKEAYKVGEYRGNAEDVNAIVKLINTKTN